MWEGNGGLGTGKDIAKGNLKPEMREKVTGELAALIHRLSISIPILQAGKLRPRVAQNQNQVGRAPSLVLSFLNTAPRSASASRL